MNNDLAYQRTAFVDRSPKIFGDWLRQHFVDTGFDEELSDWLAFELVDAFAEEYTPFLSGSGSSGGGGKATHYVIQGRELQLLDCLITGMIGSGTALGFGFAAHPDKQAVLAAITGIIVTGAKMIRNMVKRGADLSLTEYKVLSALRTSKQGGIALDEIVAKLNEMYECAEAPWKADDVQVILDCLGKTPLRDGTIVAFAQKDGHGLWHACGFE